MINKKWILIVIVALGLIGCATTKGDWEKAQEMNTTGAYQEFLSMHPQSEFTAEARGRIQKLHWQGAKQLDTLKKKNNRLKVIEEIKSKVATAASLNDLEQLLLEYNDPETSIEVVPLIENKIIEQVKTDGIGKRYAIRDIKPPLTSKEYPPDAQTRTNHGLSDHEPLSGRATIDATAETIKTETSYDNLPLSIMTTDLRQQVRFICGGIIRFYGKIDSKLLLRFLEVPDTISQIKKITFIGEGDVLHRLTFYFSKDHGLVFVRGKGRVIQNGNEVRLGY